MLFFSFCKTLYVYYSDYRAITLMQFPNCITTYGQLTEIHGSKKSPCRVIWVQKIIGFTQEYLQE